MPVEYLTDPAAIEAKSYAAIEPFLAGCPEELRPVAARIIHATGDPALGCLLQASPGAIHAGTAALAAGAPIWTDVQMVRAGIRRDASSRLGATVRCLLEEAETTTKPGPNGSGRTRTMQALEALKAEMAGSVVAVGNAPTALFQLLENDPGRGPALVVGVPVGFVGAAESKARLIREAPWPYITVRGTRGGSPVAAAAVNALLLAALGERCPETGEGPPHG